MGVLALVACAVLSVWSIRPPAVVGASAPATEFSAERAMRHLRTLVVAPRVPGTEAHARARDYLASELTGLGLETDIQRAGVAVHIAGEVMGADVENVVARLRGADPAGRAVLLVAHYDSVPGSPGASDDGAAVVALLETARALRAGPVLRNDVIVLLSDAEEIGLLGALAFAEQHRWRGDVGVALNFEARGSRGAVAMYATTPGGAPLVRALGEAAPYPIASSLVGLLATALPNDTDASMLGRFGYPTYAFAYADGVADYHRFSDSLATLDARSLQHHGEYALSLSRHLGSLELTTLRSSDELVYFDLFGRWLVRYPPLVARLLALLQLAALGALLLVFGRGGRARLRAVLKAASVALAGLLVLPLGVSASAWALGRLVGLDALVARASLFAWHFLPLCGLLFVLLWQRALRRWGHEACSVGALVPVALGATALGLLLPAASYALAWPALLATVGLLGALRLGRDASWRTELVLVLALAPGVVVAAAVLYTVQILQGAFTPGAVALFAGALVPLLVPLLGRLGLGQRRGLMLGLLVTSLGGLPVAIATADATRGRTDSLVYALDSVGNTAQWLTTDRESSPFVGQRIPAGAGAVRIDAFSPNVESRRAAPTLPALLEAPTGSKAPSASSRQRAIDVRAPASARCLLVWDDLGTAVCSATVDGRPVTEWARFSPERDEELFNLMTGRQPRAVWRLRYCALRGRPLRLELTAPGDQPLRLRVVTETDGLPDPALGPREPGWHPALGSDVTLVSTVLEL